MIYHSNHKVLCWAFDTRNRNKVKHLFDNMLLMLIKHRSADKCNKVIAFFFFSLRESKGQSLALNQSA